MGTPLQAATPLRVNLNQRILAPAAVSPIFPQVRTTGLRQTAPNPLLNASSAQSTRPQQLIPAPLFTPPHQTSITNITRERPQAPTISQPRFLPQPTYPSQAAAPSQTGVIPQTASSPGLSQTALDFQQASATAHLPHSYALPTVTSPPMTAPSPGANIVSDRLRERRATWSVARMDQTDPSATPAPAATVGTDQDEPVAELDTATSNARIVQEYPGTSSPHLVSHTQSSSTALIF